MLLGSICPDNTTLINGMCYAPCPSGYSLYNDSSGEVVCRLDCPCGTIEDKDYCDKLYPEYYSRGIPYFTRNECLVQAEACTTYNNQWYPVCKDGYGVIKDKCYKLCPNGKLTTDNKCPRVNIPFTQQPVAASYSLYTIIWIISVIVFIAVAIYFFLFGSSRSNDKLAELQYGTPGVNDTYAILKGQKVNDPYIEI